MGCSYAFGGVYDGCKDSAQFLLQNRSIDYIRLYADDIAKLMDYHIDEKKIENIIIQTNNPSNSSEDFITIYGQQKLHGKSVIHL